MGRDMLMSMLGLLMQTLLLLGLVRMEDLVLQAGLGHFVVCRRKREPGVQGQRQQAQTHGWPLWIASR